MSWAVPLSNVVVADEDIEAVLDCLRSGWLTMGPRTAKFERDVAELLGAEHAVAVSSGTAALHLALLAAGVGPGDEVIVPAFSFVASAAAVRYVGAVPVLCDVAAVDAPNLGVEEVREKLSARTRAVVAVHFMGYPAPAPEILELCREHGLILIEDAAQAICAELADGRTAGTVGDLGCFSFFSKKQLCTGEGGMVVTRDGELAARVGRLRSHAMTSMSWDRHRGHAETYDIVDIGFNYRMDEVHATLGAARLPRLSADIAARRALVARYRELLPAEGLEQLWREPDMLERSSHFAFPVMLADRLARERFRASLAAAGIQTTFYPSISELAAYRADGLPRACEVAARHCALPLCASMSIAEQDLVLAAVEAALG